MRKVPMNITLSNDVRWSLRECAAVSGLSVSAFIETLVRRYGEKLADELSLKNKAVVTNA